MKRVRERLLELRLQALDELAQLRVARGVSGAARPRSRARSGRDGLSSRLSAAARRPQPRVEQHEERGHDGHGREDEAPARLREPDALPSGEGDAGIAGHEQVADRAAPQKVRSAAMTASMTRMVTTPAAAVTLTPETSAATGRPSAARRSVSSGSANATRPQTRPQPAIGSPVRAWMADAKLEFQTATQAESPPKAQNAVPPARATSSSAQRKSAQRAEIAPRAAREASEAGLGQAGRRRGGRGRRVCRLDSGRLWLS